MKWKDMRRSRNVNDNRGKTHTGGHRSSGMSGGIGLGRILQLLFLIPGKAKWIVLLLLGLILFGGSGLLTGGPSNTQNQTNNPGYEQNQEANSSPESHSDLGSKTDQQEGAQDKSNDQGYKFMSAILGNTEDYWVEELGRHGQDYNMPTMELYTGTTRTSGCGFGTAQAGPFYCPADQTIYIDLSFMNDLQNKYQAPGDFAMAYVIAHEVGHHIQNELGIMDEYMRTKKSMGESQGNQLNVRLELQADYFAGAWAKYAHDHDFLEVGDIDEALQAAYAVGDDTIQKETYGTVVPDSFTHGSAQQRQAWFKHGFQHGDIENSDTFGTKLPSENY